MRMAKGEHSFDSGVPHSFLTTKEVAELLRVKERKVYDMAAAGEIPHRRVTGKLLFPHAEITAWIEGTGTRNASARPAVIVGSHDPLLDWAVRESGCGLATLYDGSMDGLDRFASGNAMLSGLHIPETHGWNTETVTARQIGGCVLISWAERSQGVILGRDVEKKVHRFADVAGRRVVLRQTGAGSRALFDRLAAAEGLDPTAFEAAASPARTESDAAAAIAAGDADAAIGLECMARQYRLGFLPLVTERFDLLIDRHAYFTEPVQNLFRFAHGEAFRKKATALGGYGTETLGTVRWLGP